MYVLDHAHYSKSLIFFHHCGTYVGM
jgi:hypothetical protein